VTAVYVTPDDEHGLTVHTFITGAAEQVLVARPAASDLLVLTLPVAGARLRIEGPTWALIDLLATAVEAVEQAGPGPWLLIEDEPPAGMPPPDPADRHDGPPPAP
jgi:hypothetical protein